MKLFDYLLTKLYKQKVAMSLLTDTAYNRLESFGFNPSEDKTSWEKTINTRTQGQTVIINGQRHDQPGKEITLKCSIVFKEGAWVENIDGSKHEDLTQVHFRITHDENILKDYEEIFYNDDSEIFEKILIKFLGE